MAIGKQVWYSLSLWERATHVTVIGLEHDSLGRVSWIEAIDSKGNLYRDYAVRFSICKPVQYC